MSEQLPEVRNVTDLQQGQASPDDLRLRMARMTEMIELKKQFLKNNLKEGIDKDFAVIPGCGDKKVLLKPGAEKLLDWHGYYADMTLESEKEDWDIGLFAYTYRCAIKQKGSSIVVATCDGDASSFESKYKFEWRYGSEVPAGIDKTSLKSKEFGRGDKKCVKYQLIIDNLADRRNTIRKMAQKRALMGATVLATATSDLFTTDLDPDDDDDKGDAGTQNGNAGHSESKDYGDPIGKGKKSGALYYALKEANIEEKDFNVWLKACYGWDSKEQIGEKAFKEIIDTVKTGKLPMPAPAAAESSSATESKPTGKLTVEQIKKLSAMLNALGRKESEFVGWLVTAYPQYAGIKSTNDIASSEYDAIESAFTRAAEGGLL